MPPGQWGGEKVAFRAGLFGVVSAFCLFLFLLWFSLLSYTDWGSFLRALLCREILFALRLSLITATLATFLALLVAIPSAYVLSRYPFPGKGIIDSLMDLPIVVSPVVIGAALLIFFNGPVGSFIEGKVMRFTFSVPGVVLAQFTVVSALAVRLLKATFDQVDPRYEQVARTLGCGGFKAFCKVTLPMAKRGIVAASVLAWARAVGEFGATVTLAGATPMKTETLPVAIFLSLSVADVQRAVAVVFLLVGVALVSLLVLRKIYGRIW